MGKISETKEKIKEYRATIDNAQRNLDIAITTLGNLYKRLLQEAIDRNIVTKDFRVGNYEVKVGGTDLGSYTIYAAEVSLTSSLRIWTPLNNLLAKGEMSNYDRKCLTKLKKFIEEKS